MKGLMEDNAKYSAQLIKSCQSLQKKLDQGKGLADSRTYEPKVSLDIPDFVMECVTDSLRETRCSPLATSLGFLFIV